MTTGTVNWFSDEKGFGFITAKDGSKDLFVHGSKDLFVHRSAIDGNDHRSLEEGAKVSYESEASDKGPRPVDVRVP